MRFSSILLASLALLAAIPVSAARVTPMVTEIGEVGRDATTRIEVTNPEDRNLPLELRVYKGIVGERGELELVPADEDFLVFPPQTIIEAQRQQTFRVQYLGGEPLTKSEIYYVAIKEVPVPLEPGTSRVQVVMDFNVLVNVVPDGAEADPAIDYIRATVLDGVEGIEVRVLNNGTKYFAAGRKEWAIKGTASNGEAFDLTLPASEVGKFVGYGVVPPGQARIFFVPTGTALQEGAIDVELRS